MATKTKPGFSWDEFITSLLDAYDQLGMPVQHYLILVLAPAVGVSFMAFAIALRADLPGIVRIILPILGILILASAVFYPKITLDQRRLEMENQYHLLMTHMTVLSTTNIDRMEVFRTLAREKEYGPLSEEMARIVHLVDSWNQSLDDACRMRAQQIPSKHLADLLDRLAYTLGAGQPLSDFLLREQPVIISNYETMYESALENLDVLKDLYLSMILSMTFALVFAIVLPILTGTDPTITVAAVIVMFAFVQLGFFLTIRTMVPFDPVWFHSRTLSPKGEFRLQAIFLVGVVLAFSLVGVVAVDLLQIRPGLLPAITPGVTTIHPAFYLAIPLTPLVIPGVALRIEEKRIQDRDTEFPSFIRALGASESAKQTTTSNVLRTLRRKDFGPLTENINDLYTRMAMRIDADQAWRLLAADARSYLIQKYSEMYLVGRNMGGDPKQLGELISENMNEVIQLRELRRQATITIIGLVYGITAAAAFAFFIGLEVVKILSTLSAAMTEESAQYVDELIHSGAYNIPEIEFLIYLVVLFNALLSALMIRTVDGGHKSTAYFHFVLLVWLGCTAAVMTEQLASGFLEI